MKTAQTLDAAGAALIVNGTEIMMNKGETAQMAIERLEKDLSIALLQIRDMQEIVDAAMNENMPRIRAATKAYQEKQRTEKRVEVAPKKCTVCGWSAHSGRCGEQGGSGPEDGQ